MRGEPQARELIGWRSAALPFGFQFCTLMLLGATPRIGENRGTGNGEIRRKAHRGGFLSAPDPRGTQRVPPGGHGGTRDGGLERDEPRREGLKGEKGGKSLF